MEMKKKGSTIGAGRSRSAGLVTATRVDWWRELPNYAVVNHPSGRGGASSDNGDNHHHHRHQEDPHDDDHHESEVLWETRDEAAVPTHDGGGLAWDADADNADNGAVWASARSLSTYPLLPTGQRDGDPNADCAWVRLYANRAFVALADGCNWGHRPRDAARSAVAALRDYLTRRCGRDAVVPDLHEAAHYLLRAFAEADRRIMQGKGDTWEAGTTTLIGGLLLQLAPHSSKNAKNAGDHGEKCEESSQWGFVCCSVGDCKAFHYAPARGGKGGGGEVTDITAGNRMNVTDVRDPGGRLGPYLEGGAPDLRNLKLYFMPCEPGDVLLLVSDGVHDNFDPQMLGRLPSEVGLELKDDAWESDAQAALGGGESVEVEVAKDRFRAAALQQLLEAGPLTPRAITTRLVDHCYATTRVCREFMEHSPQARQPTDYRQFPGKMDHTTAACLIGPSIATTTTSSSSSSSSS
jgi:serine/threonine protein phosphatase PrpC